VKEFGSVNPFHECWLGYCHGDPVPARRFLTFARSGKKLAAVVLAAGVFQVQKAAWQIDLYGCLILNLLNMILQAGACYAFGHAAHADNGRSAKGWWHVFIVLNISRGTAATLCAFSADAALLRASEDLAPLGAIWLAMLAGVVADVLLFRQVSFALLLLQMPLLVMSVLRIMDAWTSDLDFHPALFPLGVVAFFVALLLVPPLLDFHWRRAPCKTPRTTDGESTTASSSDGEREGPVDDARARWGWTRRLGHAKDSSLDSQTSSVAPPYLCSGYSSSSSGSSGLLSDASTVNLQFTACSTATYM
jgi:hypothetical protein